MAPRYRARIAVHLHFIGPRLRRIAERSGLYPFLASRFDGCRPIPDSLVGLQRFLFLRRDVAWTRSTADIGRLAAAPGTVSIDLKEVNEGHG